MFIHFAFGLLGKQGKTEEQTEQVIELILKNKSLKVSKCTEFIPEFPKPGSIRIPLDKMRFKSNGANAQLIDDLDQKKNNKLPDNDSIYFLQRDVSMISFIKIAFNQLRTSNHCKEYGKFGIVLADRFLRSMGIRPVKYYTEESLWSDPLIRKWNYELKSLSPDRRKDCEKEILTYRKPATLFSTFKNSVMAKITVAPSGGAVEFLRYNRYPEGYDFTKENEYRIAFDGGVDYLYFGESDLFMIITPDLKAKDRVESFLKHNWSRQPEVEVFSG